jgi:hypothetical protein
MTHLTPSRRDVIAALALLPAAGAIAAHALPPSDPITRYWTAFDAYNDLQIGDEAYDKALYEMLDFEPTNSTDFVRKFLCLFDEGGNPAEYIMRDMIGNARRLASYPASGRA